MKRKRSLLFRRRGATAIEFAIVAPVLFLIVFSIFELTRLMMFSGNVNTALLQGVRQASLSESTATEVDELIRSELRRFGINEAEISFTPAQFVSTDTELTIDIKVPLGSTNGLHLSRLTLSDSRINKSISFGRE